MAPGLQDPGQGGTGRFLPLAQAGPTLVETVGSRSGPFWGWCSDKVVFTAGPDPLSPRQDGGTSSPSGVLLGLKLASRDVMSFLKDNLSLPPTFLGYILAFILYRQFSSALEENSSANCAPNLDFFFFLRERSTGEAA